MNASKAPTNTGLVDPDDAPDLSAPEWQAKLDAAPVQRGRPKSEKKKVFTGIRLDEDVLEHFKATGSGWQTRINTELRKIAGLS